MEMLGPIFAAIASIAVAVCLTGCSLEVRAGYYGKTGVDNREQTQLVGTEQDRDERRR